MKKYILEIAYDEDTEQIEYICEAIEEDESSDNLEIIIELDEEYWDEDTVRYMKNVLVRII